MVDEAGTPPDTLETALTDVVAVLVRAGIPYALIGGLATGYRSRPRYTKDIDLILDIPQVAIPAVLDALASLGFEFDPRTVAADFTQRHMAVLWRGGVRVDWLKPLLPVYRHILVRAREEPGPAGPIRVATAEGLILLKLLAFRLQDQTDVEALVAANRDGLDVDWIIAEWQSVFEPDDPRMQWFLGLLATDHHGHRMASPWPVEVAARFPRAGAWGFLTIRRPEASLRREARSASDGNAGRTPNGSAVAG